MASRSCNPFLYAMLLCHLNEQFSHYPHVGPCRRTMTDCSILAMVCFEIPKHHSYKFTANQPSFDCFAHIRTLAHDTSSRDRSDGSSTSSDKISCNDVPLTTNKYITFPNTHLSQRLLKVGIRREMKALSCNLMPRDYCAVLRSTPYNR